MECINEAMALKSSFLSGVAMKSHQVFHDEFWVATAGIYGGGGGGGGVSDDFSVDDLLDLSDKDFVKVGCSNSSVSPSDECVEFSEEDEEKDFLSVSSSQDTLSNFSGQTSFTSLPAAGELPVPVDDIENLEWLSKIVDDSTSEVSLLCPAEKNMKFPVTRFEPVSRPVPVQEFSVLGFSKPVPRKIRSKRFKPTGKAWPIGSFSLTESSSTSSSSIDSSVTSETRFSCPTSVLDSMVFFGKPPAKKQRKYPSPETGSGSMGLQPARRCTHCQVQKTPQWRTGPLGPKTLCNACGVRFKSGRLFPEYRPACSPTFSGDVHSNSHRKVLEMRRKKESLEMVRPGSSLAVSSF